MCRQEHTLRLFDPEIGEADRARLEQAMDRALREIDARILEFLGGDAYADYEGYEKSLPERTMIGTCRRTLENAGRALSYEQEDALIRMMYEERAGSPDLGELFESRGMPPAFSADESTAVLWKFDGWQRRVVARASNILGPEQMAAFEADLQTVRYEVELALMLAPLIRETMGAPGED